MSILDNLAAKMALRRKKAIAPTVTDSTNAALVPQDDNTNSFIAGHENYNEYTELPNVLGPMNMNRAFHNPARLHAPFAMERNREYYLTGGGVVFFDSANPEIQHVPNSDLQNYFNQKKEIPVPSAYVPANGVEVPKRHYNYGWSQHAPIAYDVMYGVSVMSAPSPHLSRGINVLQSTLPNDIHRASMKTKAPRQKRSVQ